MSKQRKSRFSWMCQLVISCRNKLSKYLHTINLNPLKYKRCEKRKLIPFKLLWYFSTKVKEFLFLLDDLFTKSWNSYFVLFFSNLYREKFNLYSMIRQKMQPYKFDFTHCYISLEKRYDFIYCQNAKYAIICQLQLTS